MCVVTLVRALLEIVECLSLYHAQHLATTEHHRSGVPSRVVALIVESLSVGGLRAIVYSCCFQAIQQLL